MFEIQEDHAMMILGVAKKVNVPFWQMALLANVTKLVKTTMTAHMKINVGTKSACPRNVQ